MTFWSIGLIDTQYFSTASGLVVEKYRTQGHGIIEFDYLQSDKFQFEIRCATTTFNRINSPENVFVLKMAPLLQLLYSTLPITI